MKALLDQLKPGLRVYVQGGTGESLGLIAALKAAPDAAAGVEFVSGLIPGMNAFDYAALTPTTRLTTFMPIAACAATIKEGRTRVPPMFYSGMADWFSRQDFDLAVLHVAPGRDAFSFGIAADFGPLVWKNAARVCAILNARMPAMKRGPILPRAACDMIVETDDPLIETNEAEPSEDLRAIAAQIAALVPEGAAIQTGVGGAPAAALPLLKDHRGLVIRSGMVTDGYRVLAEAGAFATDGHITGLAFGSRGLYDFLRDADLVHFADAHETHGPGLGAPEKFTAINSALEIDLFGQANIEWRGETLVSGVGGAPDFTRAARRSKSGRAIIALPATAQGGKVSRIVARLSSPTASIPRADVDTIVTEHGVAELIGKSPAERAEALIAIAAPAFRDDLARALRV